MVVKGLMVVKSMVVVCKGLIRRKSDRCGTRSMGLKKRGYTSRAKRVGKKEIGCVGWAGCLKERMARDRMKRSRGEKPRRCGSLEDDPNVGAIKMLKSIWIVALVSIIHDFGLPGGLGEAILMDRLAKDSYGECNKRYSCLELVRKSCKSWTRQLSFGKHMAYWRCANRLMSSLVDPTT
ncbi:unnamed protein product [Dovyalis caffra]|uniref:Uncharacterized protein n=1 Tax=Dovyalis caffra TaxID=77055 RepID=A0AAV1SGM9_9ROSI|nr:unnamed protein product [Dovyalis caffra]